MFKDDYFKHRCDVTECSFRSRNKWDLKNHQIHAHYRGEKFYCYIGNCKSVFKTRNYLINHMNKTKLHVNKSRIKVPQQSQRHCISTISTGEQWIPVLKNPAGKSAFKISYSNI